jgi:hypothetical protein
MFRGSEKGLKEDPLCFGSPLGEVKSHANEAQMCNQEKLKGLPSLQSLVTAWTP